MPISALIAAAALLAGVQSAGLPGAEVQAPGPSGPLRGTMIEAAEDKAPLLLIVPGSGPTDRDGNSPLGIKAAPYRFLAEALAAQGVSTVRVDKRGMFGSAQAGDANAATVRGYASDIRSWVDTLRTGSKAPCIWVMGHSEGSLMALAAAAEKGEGICGLVLVSGAGRRLGDVLREQLRAAPGFAPHLETALAAIGTLERGQRVETTGMGPVLLSLFRPEVQDFMIENFSHDPATLAAKVDLPILVLQGQADIQTSEADARRLAQANPGARLVLLPGVNHVLKAVASGDRAANVATYADPSLPLAPLVAEVIAGFVKR